LASEFDENAEHIDAVRVTLRFAPPVDFVLAGTGWVLVVRRTEAPAEDEDLASLGYFTLGQAELTVEFDPVPLFPLLRTDKHLSGHWLDGTDFPEPCLPDEVSWTAELDFCALVY
jgi:hypothetical protein